MTGNKMAGLYRNAAVVALLAISFVQAGPAQAESKAERQQAAADLVTEALACEVDGRNSEREELLESALQKVPNFPSAMWQSGHVQSHNKWIQFDEMPDRAQSNRALKAYRLMREKTPATVPGQMALAEWCAERKLPLRTRAHLNQVIELDPEHEQAHALLGYQQVDGQWLDAAEMQAMRDEAVRLNAALQEWQPKLAELLSELESKQLSRRELAREALGKIEEPDAVPAIELILARHSEDVANLAVELLNRINTVEAVEALTRIAVYTSWDSVHEAAIYQLKPRDPAAYAPVLIAMLESPFVSRAEFARDQSGQYVYRHLIYREGQEEVEATVNQTDYPLTILGPEPTRRSRSQRSQNRIPSQGERRQMLDVARMRDATIKAAAIETSVAQQNLSSRERNKRVCAVLSGATGVELPPEAKDWWQWWSEYNGTYASGDKPLTTSRNYDSVQYRDPYRYVRDEPRVAPRRSTLPTTGSGTRRLSAECLLAGTLVYTEIGYVPIEEIKVGDLVLSQHPETGQLAYQPVINTTVRPPTDAVHIRAGKEELCSSGGHPFWVAGQGWKFARDIQAPMLLHTVVGTTVVEDAEPFGVDEFYNLEVADFHTFFVTKSNILTHDVTTREATDNAVPGLVKQ